MLEEKILKLIRTSSNDIRLGNMCTHHPSKEQASNSKTTDGKEYVKHHIPGKKKNVCVREKKKVTNMNEQARRPKWTWAGHVNRISAG